jgi:hypothetical protein
MPVPDLYTTKSGRRARIPAPMERETDATTAKSSRSREERSSILGARLQRTRPHRLAHERIPQMRKDRMRVAVQVLGNGPRDRFIFLWKLKDFIFQWNLKVRRAGTRPHHRGFGT